MRQNDFQNSRYDYEYSLTETEKRYAQIENKL